MPLRLLIAGTWQTNATVPAAAALYRPIDLGKLFKTDTTGPSRALCLTQLSTGSQSGELMDIYGFSIKQARLL